MTPSRGKRVEVRVSEFEKAEWTRAAGGVKMLSDWLRALANQACASEDSKLAAAGFSPSTSAGKITPSALVTKIECPRFMHHRPGVYCSACEKVN